MLKSSNSWFALLLVAVGVTMVAASDAKSFGDVNKKWSPDKLQTFALDTPPVDSLPYPIPDSYDPTPTGEGNGLYLNDPSNIQTEIDYDSESGDYYIEQNVGEDIHYRPPTYMSFDEYPEYNANQPRLKARITASAAAQDFLGPVLMPCL